MTPANVTPGSFGKLFSLPVDGHVYTQPLFVPNVAIAGGTHNVIFVATQNDTAFAFDADQQGPPLWKTSLVNGAGGEGAVPCNAGAVPVDGCSIAPTIGVTATPVIDIGRNAIYIEARSTQGGAFFHKLHALDLSTGAEKFGGPVTITASVPGTASDSAGGNVVFNPLRENSRPGLLEVNGVVYMTYASISDVSPYHGWLLGYNADTLQPVSVFNTTPNGARAGIWGNNGPAADANGNIFFVTGNGTANAAGNSFGNAFIKLAPGNGQLQPADFFMPSDASALNDIDTDLGSAGLTLLPDQAGPHPHMLISAGKSGKIYLIDRDNMGKFNTTDQVVQEVPNAVGNSPDGSDRNFYSPVFFNGTVFFSGGGDVVKGFSLQNGLLSTTPSMQASTHPFSFPGAGLVLSANGNSAGILWALEWHADNSTGPTHTGTLHAYDATNLKELWNSDQSGKDGLGLTTRLNVPLVINGKVYVSGESAVIALGLLPH